MKRFCFSYFYSRSISDALMTILIRSKLQDDGKDSFGVPNLIRVRHSSLCKNSRWVANAKRATTKRLGPVVGKDYIRTAFRGITADK